MLPAEEIESSLAWLLEMTRAQRIELAKLPISALIGFSWRRWMRL